MKYCIAHLSGAVALLFFMLSTTNAQSYHQLTMNDFEGIPRTKNGSIIAYTNCSIDFRYMANKEKNYYRLDFNIQLTLNHNKSWMDKQKISSAEMLSEILKHEQGHYLIAYLEQQE